MNRYLVLRRNEATSEFVYMSIFEAGDHVGARHYVEDHLAATGFEMELYVLEKVLDWPELTLPFQLEP